MEKNQRVRVLPATTAGRIEHGSIVSIVTPNPALPKAQRITVAFDDGTRCSVPSFRVEPDPDDHGPGCDGPLICTCNPYPDIDAAHSGRDDG